MWSSEVEDAMPPTLCQSTLYFMTCFDIDAKQCSDIIRTISRDCLDQIDQDVPEALSESEITKWSNVFGHCVGTTYTTQLTNDGRKKTGPGC